jgi:DNA-binding response OmpR family regulator
MDERTAVLIVEDDRNIVDLLRSNLLARGFRVLVSMDGSDVLRRLDEAAPDIVLLDLMLPGIDGFELCRSVRERSGLGIVVISARRGETDKVRALNLGADDYLTKPFSPRELVLRVGSVLRRAHRVEPAPEVLTDRGLVVDVARRTATLHGAPLALTVREFELLAYLMRHPGRAFTRTELLEAVWGWTFGDHSTVTVHVRRLREKVEGDPASPSRIFTVWGRGYRYEVDDA